uniref:Coiled-coil domain containing 90B n=1 Tax=Oryctolagus cuniculus TaxID=9986 RepID=A0A5F9DA49_RABIT
MRSAWVWRLLRSKSSVGDWLSAPHSRFSPLFRRGFLTTTNKEGYDRRPVDITPLEQRKLTFDTHALVQDLETNGFDKAQAETIVSALTTLSNVSLDTIYKEMVTQAQQEITVQQLMAHLDSIRKDMVILEKSEFANLRAENEKMQIELDEVKQQLMHETSRIRADNKLDINLERSRVTDMFTDQEKQLMEATTEFTRKHQCLLAWQYHWDFIESGSTTNAPLPLPSTSLNTKPEYIFFEHYHLYQKLTTRLFKVYDD